MCKFANVLKAKGVNKGDLVLEAGLNFSNAERFSAVAIALTTGLGYRF